MEHAWTYDKLNRLKEAQLASPNPLEFTYYANDDLETITHGNGVTTEYAYWPEGPVQSITVESPSEQLLKLTYTVNKVLNVTGMNEQHAASGPVHAYTYGYDALDRLTSATYPTALGLPASESFAYDAAGNREDPSNASLYDYDANNRITASPGKVWAYDGDGNPVSVNAGTGAQETFLHDAQNRMRGYTNATTNKSASYRNDTEARRIEKSVNSVTTWYVWEGEHLLAGFDATGVRVERYGYVRGPAPLERATPADPSERVESVHLDRLATPRVLTNGASAAVWRTTYLAFGGAEPDEDPDGDSADVGFGMRLPGQLADDESALNQNRFRYFDPATGRYLNTDPIGQFGGANPFSYAGNNPLARIDPRGEFIFSLGGAAAGASIATFAYLGYQLGRGCGVDPSSLLKAAFGGAVLGFVVGSFVDTAGITGITLTGGVLGGASVLIPPGTIVTGTAVVGSGLGFLTGREAGLARRKHAPDELCGS